MSRNCSAEGLGLRRARRVVGYSLPGGDRSTFQGRAWAGLRASPEREFSLQCGWTAERGTDPGVASCAQLRNSDFVPTPWETLQQGTGQALESEMIRFAF